MQFKIPKNNERYHWTLHSIEKMKHYGLSEQKVLGVIHRSQRKEEGIVKNTIAVMQPAGNITKKNGKEVWKQEIWAMYQLRKGEAISKSQFTISKKSQNLKFENLQNLLNPKKIKIISAWRYPGVSPKNNPIPEEILNELQSGDLQ